MARPDTTGRGQVGRDTTRTGLGWTRQGKGHRRARQDETGLDRSGHGGTWKGV